MKKRISPFIAGMLTTAVLGFLGITALAASGTVTFNASNLSFNGTQISAKGENYTLANGQSVPASITYTDEKGGGTTYLPVRRIAELMGVETGWDGATGSVTVKGEVKAPAEPTTPPNTTTSTDYSDWSKEDEAAYQEFKGMWKVKQVTDKFFWNDEVQLIGETFKRDATDLYYMNCKDIDVKYGTNIENVQFFETHLKDKAEKYIPRLLDEIAVSERNVVIVFQANGTDCCRALKLKDGTIKTEYADPDNYY